MTYVITGLPLEPFRPLFGLPDSELEAQGAIRRHVGDEGRFPCRITLEDTPRGGTVLLLNHESHSVDTPYRSAYAIFVSEAATETAVYRDELPPVFKDRPIALRIFDAHGMLIGADLARDEGVEPAILKAFDNPSAAYIHAHNAAHGCFSAKIERG